MVGGSAGISVPAVIDRVALVRYDRAAALRRRDPLASPVLESVTAALPTARRFDRASFVAQVLGQGEVEQLPLADFVRADAAYRLTTAGGTPASLLSESA